MPDPDSSREGVEHRVTVRELSRLQRALFSLVGIAGLSGGGVAVFESGNQAGTVALLAVGSISSLLSVVGKVPLRWVIGGHEFDMSEAAAIEAVEVVASQLKPPETAELARRLARLEPGRRSSMTNAMLDYVSFEQAAIGRVMQAIAPKGWTYASASHVADRGIDGLIVGPGNTAVPVEYKFGRSPSSLRSAIRRFQQSQGQTSYSDVILVAGGAPLDFPRLTTELGSLTDPRVHLIEADDPEFDATLVAALEHAFHA